MNDKECKCHSCGGISDISDNFCTACGIQLNKPSEVGICELNPGSFVIMMPIAGLLIGTAMAIAGNLGIYSLLPVVLFAVVGSIIGLVLAPFTYNKKTGFSYLSITGILICFIILLVIFLAIKFANRY